MRLRKYQQEAIASIETQLEQHDSTLLELATGCGKTVVFCTLADRWRNHLARPGRVLVVAHREELIEQAAEKIREITGEHPDIEMGQYRAVACNTLGSPYVVASIQTLSSVGRISRFPRDYFSLIIIDEGHHAAGESYLKMLGYFCNYKLLLVTATPKRHDKKGLDGICSTISYQYGIEDATEAGYLVPIHQQVVKVDGLDFSKARSVGGDFNAGDLDRILNEEKPLHEMVASSYEIVGKRPTLWFAASVNHAKSLALVLERYTEFGRVEYLSGNTDKLRRREIISKYKEGKIQHLLNCGLFLEGFDAPTTAAVVMARPTKSLPLYTQVLGRGTRVLPGVIEGIECPDQRRRAIAASGKPDVLIIDFAGNAGRHKIVTATDVLSGETSPEIIEYAGQLLRGSTKPVGTKANLLRSQLELALISQEQSRLREIERAASEKMKGVKAKASYQTYSVSPFQKEYRRLTDIPLAPGKEQPTEKQVKYLIHLFQEAGDSKSMEEIYKMGKRLVSFHIGRLVKELEK